MPDEKSEGARAQQTDLFLRQRVAVNDAYASIRGSEVAGGFAQFTFEDAADEQIAAIEGAGSDTHPGKLARVRTLKDNLVSAVEAIKLVPPEKFVVQERNDSANTPNTPEE